MIKQVTLSLFSLAIAPVCLGQAQAPVLAPTVARVAWQDRLFKSPETVLPLLYEAAISHSAVIERLDAAKQVADEDIKLARKKILNSFSVGASYNYGTLPYFTTTGSGGNIDPVKSQLNAFTLPARAQYNTGVNMIVPLEALSSRRNLVHKQELLVQQAAAERKVGESEIRREVIILYQDLTLAKANLQHYQDAVQSASISKKLADTKFRGGEIQVDEQMAAMDLYSKAILAQEEAKNKYQTSLLLLEDLVGTPLNQLLSDK